MNKILYDIKEFLVLSKCPSCGTITRRSGTLCAECLEKYKKEKDAPCRFCGMPASVCVCSTRGLFYSRRLGASMRSVLFYTGENEVFASLLKHLKYDPDRGAEKFLARDLSHELLLLFAGSGEFPGDWRVTFPPRRRGALGRYGFDQSAGLAKRIAKYTGAAFEKTFSRRGDVAQKTLGSEERKKNAERSYVLKRGVEVKGGRYIIVDDVITSGSTVKACERILLSRGASEVFALSVAKTPMRGAGYDERPRFRKRKGELWFGK